MRPSLPKRTFERNLLLGAEAVVGLKLLIRCLKRVLGKLDARASRREFNLQSVNARVLRREFEARNVDARVQRREFDVQSLNARAWNVEFDPKWLDARASNVEFDLPSVKFPPPSSGIEVNLLKIQPSGPA